MYYQFSRRPTHLIRSSSDSHKCDKIDGPLQVLPVINKLFNLIRAFDNRALTLRFLGVYVEIYGVVYHLNLIGKAEDMSGIISKIIIS